VKVDPDEQYPGPEVLLVPSAPLLPEDPEKPEHPVVP